MKIDQKTILPLVAGIAVGVIATRMYLKRNESKSNIGGFEMRGTKEDPICVYVDSDGNATQRHPMWCQGGLSATSSRPAQIKR